MSQISYFHLVKKKYITILPLRDPKHTNAKRPIHSAVDNTARLRSTHNVRERLKVTA